jgi:hypothetical protein
MGKTKDYEIGICCFYAALRCKSKDWLTQIHDNVYEWFYFFLAHLVYKGPSIDASYQVSVHLAKGFQRRRLKCEKLTDDRRWMTDAK